MDVHRIVKASVPKAFVQTITPRYTSSTAIIVHWELLLLAAVNLHLLGVQLIEGVIANA